MKPKHLVTILAVSLIIAALFVATQPVDAKMALASSVFIILFAAPSYFAIVRTKGYTRGLSIIALLGVYALIVETSAIKTGFPYGSFVYNDLLGNKILDTTPWTVAFAYPPILLLTYWYARQRHGTRNRLKVAASTAFDAMLIDLVLDPAAVKLGFWEWINPGFYYGVPLINFAGWLLTGFIGGLILTYILPGKLPKALTYSGAAILWFWTFVNLFSAQFMPALIGVLLIMLFAHALQDDQQLKK